MSASLANGSLDPGVANGNGGLMTAVGARDFVFLREHLDCLPGEQDLPDIFAVTGVNTMSPETHSEWPHRLSGRPVGKFGPSRQGEFELG